MGAISNLQIVKPPQKTTCQILLPPKNPEIKSFLGGAFWSENGYRLCLSGIHGFRGNNVSVWTYLSFQFQIACENISSVWRRFKWLRNKEKYANSKWILTNLFCFCSKYRNGSIFTFGTSRELKGHLFEKGRFFLFWETTECSKQNFNIFWKRNNKRSFSNNKYTVNVQLTWGNFDRFLRRYLWQRVTYINTVRFDDSVERILFLYCSITVCEQLKENEPRLIHTCTLIL